MLNRPLRDLRRSERHIVRVIAHVATHEEGERFGAGAYTLDISPFGSRVHTPLDTAPGGVVEFQPEDSSLVTRCRVVWRGEPGSGREGEIGLEFLETFPAPRED